MYFHCIFKFINVCLSLFVSFVFVCFVVFCFLFFVLFLFVCCVFVGLGILFFNY